MANATGRAAQDAALLGGLHPVSLSTLHLIVCMELVYLEIVFDLDEAVHSTHQPPMCVRPRWLPPRESKKPWTLACATCRAHHLNPTVADRGA